jgi:prepilin peptidase CpaA
MIINDEFLSTTTAIVLFVVLAAAVVTDLRNRQIPNLLLLPPLCLALMLHSMSGGISGLITAAGGLTLGLAMLLPLYLIGGMAAGDVKLLGVVGSFVGPSAAVVAGLATMMVGAVFGITFIVWHRLHPALESHTTQILSPHTTGMRSTSVPHSSARRNDVTYIPYAPAIAVGTAAALWYLDFFQISFGNR